MALDLDDLIDEGSLADAKSIIGLGARPAPAGRPAADRAGGPARSRRGRGIPDLAVRRAGPGRQHGHRLPPRSVAYEGWPGEAGSPGGAGHRGLERYLGGSAVPADRARPRWPGPWWRSGRCTGSCSTRATPRPDGRAGAPRLPKGLPKPLSEDQVLALLDAVGGRRAGRPAGTGPSSRCSTAPGCASRRLVGLSLADLEPGRWPAAGCSARAPRSATCRWAGWPGAGRRAWLGAGGRPLVPRPLGPSRRRRGAVPQRRGSRLPPPGRLAAVRRRAERGGLGDRG